MSAVRLPRRLPGQSADDYLEVLVASIERTLSRSQAGTYRITNAVANRTLDSGTATAPQTAQVLATLVQDLRIGGVLG